MTTMKCPDCGAQSFYVKDPDDQYTISEFDVKEGVVNYSSENIEHDPLLVEDDTETFCDRCAWHDKFKTLKAG